MNVPRKSKERAMTVKRDVAIFEYFSEKPRLIATGVCVCVCMHG